MDLVGQEVVGETRMSRKTFVATLIVPAIIYLSVVVAIAFEGFTYLWLSSYRVDVYYSSILSVQTIVMAIWLFLFLAAPIAIISLVFYLSYEFIASHATVLLWSISATSVIALIAYLCFLLSTDRGYYTWDRLIVETCISISIACILIEIIMKSHK